VKLSIFRQANWLPKTKDEKSQQGRLASHPNLPDTVEISNDDELVHYVTSFAWSPSVFSGSRKDENFVSADFMTLDVDSGMTIAEAEKRAQKLDLCCLCLPSPSYTEKEQKFRLVFPLAKTIFNDRDFDATWDWLQEQFPELDRQCSDEARYYCPSKLDDGFFQDGAMLVPVKAKQEEPQSSFSTEQQILVTEDLAELVKQIYGKPREKIPEAVSFFLQNAGTGLPGLWVNSLNAFAFSLSLSGVDGSIIEQVTEQLAPNPLDSTDLYQIKRAVRDGKKSRENSGL
jgi:hypothetical protein